MKLTQMRFAVATMVVGLGVILLALFFWKDIAGKYYLRRMQSDSDFLNEVVGDLRQNSIKKQAFEQFMQSTKAIPLLIKSVLDQRWDPFDEDFDDEEVPYAAKTLVLIGESAVPKLVETLEKCSLSEWQGQDKTLYVLRRMGPKAESAIPIVAQQLAHEAWEIPDMAASTLGEIGKGSEAARVALEAVLKDKNTDIDTVIVREALKKIQGDSATILK